MTDEERFFAWLDGELGPKEASEVAAAVARNLALQRKAESHRALKRQLEAAFAPLAEQPVLLPAAPVIDLAAERERRSEREWWQQASALAATLILGLLIGTRIAATESPGDTKPHMLVASAGLERMLDRQLASAPAAGAVRVVLTFRDRKDRICRTFRGSSSSGLACSDGGEWVIEALLPSAEGQSSQFRMASGADPRLAELVDEMIVGEPFNAVEERSARELGWTETR